MIESLQALAEERAEKRTTYPVRELPNLQTLPVQAWLGTYSYTLPSLKTRYALDRVALHTFGQWQTPTEIARDYLSTKYTRKIRQFSDQYRLNDWHPGFPYLAVPTVSSDLAYVDLKSAYWTIVQVAGWDVEYMPGQFFGRMSAMNDFPLAENKLSRNTLVSTASASHISMWTGQKIVSKHTGSTLRNPRITSLVADVLHGVAWDMERLGAIYVHTDGYIFPRHLARPAMRFLYEAWGLPARIKAEGPGLVKALGAYKVGESVSGLLAQVGTKPSRHIVPRNRVWLRGKFRHHRDRVKLYYGDKDEMGDANFREWCEWSP